MKMTQYDTTRHNAKSYKVLQYDMIRNVTIRYNENTIRYKVIEKDAKIYDAIEKATIQHNTIRRDTIRYSMTSRWPDLT